MKIHFKILNCILISEDYTLVPIDKSENKIIQYTKEYYNKRHLKMNTKNYCLANFASFAYIVKCIHSKYYFILFF